MNADTTRGSRIRRELLITAVPAAILWLVAAQIDLMERVIAWSQNHEALQIDELLMLFVVGTIAGWAFVALRGRDLQRAAAAQEAALRALRASEDRLTKTFAASPSALAIGTPDGMLLEVNDEFARLTGHERAAALGVSVQQLGVWDPHELVRVQQVLQREARIRNFEVQVRRADGDVRTTLLSAEPIEFAGRAAIVASMSDITERKQLEDQLAHRAFHDELTRLPNRALFYNRVDHALARAQRHDRPPAILFLDLDGFKRVNDTLGHNVGDRLLVAVAERLIRALRPSDTCARLGGDEFAILLEAPNSRDEVTRLADRLLGDLRPPFDLDGSVLHMSASIGIVIAEGRARPDEMLRDADLAMYLSKSNGKGRHTLFEASMYAEAVRRVELETDLRHAVERGQFVLHYQPIASLPDAHINGVEALVRWQHPTRGLLHPSEFIPIAEEIGVIHALGAWVLLEACALCRSLEDQQRGDQPFVVAVNVSGRQLETPAIIDRVKEALGVTGLDPAQLVLEITESVLVRTDAETTDCLWKLKRLGVQLAIDDFGTGYSSLAYLQQFPVDVIKIDKSFTDRLGTGVEDSPLSRAVFALGSSLNIRTVAEGIESIEQWRTLCGFAEAGQGFLIAHPMPAGQLRQFLQRGADGHGAGTVAALLAR